MSSPRSPKIPLPLGEGGSRSESGEGLRSRDTSPASDGTPTHFVGTPVPTTLGDPVAAQIAAEIADHLATAAERLQARGVSPGEVQEKSQEKFGDAATISRRCYWIQQGDFLMFRGALIVLLSALAIGLAVTTVLSWRAQSRMAEQVNALTEQLKALAESQKAAPLPAPVPPSPKPLEIIGRVYVGSPDKPATHTRITILDVKDGSRVRTVATDADGNFQSGPLGGGEYALLAETGQRLLGDRTERWVQSPPIGVYPGLDVPRQQFDTAYHAGQLAIEMSRPLPKLTVENRYTLDSRLLVKVYSSQDRAYLWISANDSPQAWPVYPRLDLPPLNQ
jgi:hypothetical protein